MTTKVQIDNILFAITTVKYNIELIKKYKIKNKYALKNMFDSIDFHLKVINKIIKIIWEEYNGK